MKKLTLLSLFMILFSAVYATNGNENVNTNQKSHKNLKVLKPGESFTTSIGVAFQNNTDYNFTIQYIADDSSDMGYYYPPAQAIDYFYAPSAKYYHFVLSTDNPGDYTFVNWSDTDSNSGSICVNGGDLFDYIHDGQTITIDYQ